MSNHHDRLALVLRPAAGQKFDAVVEHAQPGSHVSVGRGLAVIDYLISSRQKPVETERLAFEQLRPRPELCTWDAEAMLYVGHASSDELASNERNVFLEDWELWKARAALDRPPVPTIKLPPFAEKVIKDLQRVESHISDSQTTDVSRESLDKLAALGLLERPLCTPTRWVVTEQGYGRCRCLRGTASCPAT